MSTLDPTGPDEDPESHGWESSMLLGGGGGGVYGGGCTKWEVDSYTALPYVCMTCCAC